MLVLLLSVNEKNLDGENELNYYYLMKNIYQKIKLTSSERSSTP